MLSNIINIRPTLRRLGEEDFGQDLIEYGLLGAIVGIGSILTWQLVVTTVGEVYTAADADIQDLSGCTPDPLSVGGGCS